MSIVGDYIKWNPYAYMAGIVILLASHGYVYFTGKEHGLERYYDFKSKVEATNESIRLDNERKLAQAVEVTRKLDQDFAVARAELARLGRVVRVRDACSGTGILPSLSANATSIEGLQASQSGLGSARTITVEECETRINGSITDAVWIEHVKVWADEQSKVKP